MPQQEAKNKEQIAVEGQQKTVGQYIKIAGEVAGGVVDSEMQSLNKFMGQFFGKQAVEKSQEGKQKAAASPNSGPDVKASTEKEQTDISTQIKEAQKTIVEEAQKMQKNPDIAGRIESAVKIFQTLIGAAGGILRRIFPALPANPPAPNSVIAAPNTASQTLSNTPQIAPSSAPNAPGSAPDVLDRDMRAPLNLAQSPKASADRIQASIESQEKQIEGLEKQDKTLQEELNKLDRSAAGIKRRREIRELQNKVDEQLFQINSRINAAQNRIKELRAEQQRRNDLVTRDISNPPAMLAALEGDRIDLTYAHINDLQSLQGIQLMTRLINGLPATMRTNPDGSAFGIATNGGMLQMHNVPPMFFTQEAVRPIGLLLRQLAESGLKDATMNPKERMEKLDAAIRALRQNMKEAAEAFNKSAGQPNEARIKLGRSAESAAQALYDLAEDIAGDPSLPVTFRDGAFNAREEAAKTLKTIREQIAKLEKTTKENPLAPEPGGETPAKRLEDFNKARANLAAITDSQLQGLRNNQLYGNYENFVILHEREDSYLRGAAALLEGAGADGKKVMVEVAARREILAKMRAEADKIGNQILTKQAKDKMDKELAAKTKEKSAKEKIEKNEAAKKKLDDEAAKKKEAAETSAKRLEDFNKTRSDNQFVTRQIETAFRQIPDSELNQKQLIAQLAHEESHLNTAAAALDGNPKNVVDKVIAEVNARLKEIASLRKEVMQVVKKSQDAAKKKLDDESAKKKLDDAAKKKLDDAAKKKEAAETLAKEIAALRSEIDSLEVMENELRAQYIRSTADQVVYLGPPPQPARRKEAQEQTAKIGLQCDALKKQLDDKRAVLAKLNKMLNQ